MDDAKQPKPYFTWRDSIFGENVIAGSLHTLGGIGAFILLFGTLTWWLAK